MPIYEFTCQACGKLTEVMQRLGDPPPRCSACGSKRTARAVSRTAFHLKGGGWYADLYSTPPPPGAVPKEGKEPGKVSGDAPGQAQGATTTAAPAGAEAPAAATPSGPGPGAHSGKKPPVPAGRARKAPARKRR